jgi:hypothetical protein
MECKQAAKPSRIRSEQRQSWTSCLADNVVKENFNQGVGKSAGD